MTELSTLIAYVEDYLDQTREARELAERDRDYYDGKQLTSEELAAYKARRQPPIVFNRIKPKVDSLLGFERAQRTDPRAYPRTPKHDQEAEGATDALRFVADQERFQQKRSAVAENIFIEGAGGALFGVKPNRKGGFDVTITHIPWDRLIYDPHSTTRDFSDCKFKGTMLWMDDDDAKSDFKGKEAAIDASLSDTYDSDTFDDKPRTAWADTKRKRIRVCVLYYREAGKWMVAAFVRGGYLKDPAPSPYLDEDGDPVCPIEIGCAYIDRDNNRYGVVRQHIDPQDEVNKRRSKALHLLNVRQVVAEKGAVDDVNKARAELAKPDGYIEVNPMFEFNIQPAGELAAGHVQLLQEAKNEIDVIGVNPSLQGNQQAPSGRAQEMLQQAGLNELAVVFDSIRDWTLRSYRQIWLRCRQFWTEERWVRVTDDEQNMKWVGLNKPITVGEAMMQQGGGQLPPGIDPNDPRLSEPAGVENEVARMDMDILIEDGPDGVNIQSEQFELLVQMYQANPEAIPLDMVIEASSLRNKRRILEKMKGDPQRAQIDQEAQGIAKAKAVAEVKKTESEAIENIAQAEKLAQDGRREMAQAAMSAEFGQRVPLVSIN